MRDAAAFLAAAGWGSARRTPLAGDASPRRYERLFGAAGTAVLMDADPASGEDVRPFMAIAAHLAALGLSPPSILAADEDAGFLLLEDLGDALYARVVAARPTDEGLLYAAAVDVLAHLQAAPPPPGLAAYDAAAMGAAAGLAVTWYAAGAGARAADPAPLVETVAAAVAALDAPPVLTLRDYHAENLLWLPDRSGLRRVGLLDFQSAELAPGAYDLVSLVQDARRDVSPDVAAAMIDRHAAATGQGDAATRGAVAVLGAQRALRILGVFARLCLRDGKPGYLRLIPRVWGQLQANLADPRLAAVAGVVRAVLPAPSPDVLDRIGARCGTGLPR
jgi:aminoglycoside/choline kinase family phosphotransferase